MPGLGEQYASDFQLLKGYRPSRADLYFIYFTFLQTAHKQQCTKRRDVCALCSRICSATRFKPGRMRVRLQYETWTVGFIKKINDEERIFGAARILFFGFPMKIFNKRGHWPRTSPPVCLWPVIKPKQWIQQIQCHSSSSQKPSSSQ